VNNDEEVYPDFDIRIFGNRGIETLYSHVFILKEIRPDVMLRKGLLIY